MKKHLLILITALLAAAGAQASCYTVLGPKGNILSQSPNPPVNMAYPLHETLTNKYGPGARMVFGIAEADCGKRVETWGNDGTVKKTAASPGAKKTVKGHRAARHKAPAKPQQPAQAAPAQAEPAQAQPQAQTQPPTVQAQPQARKSRSQRETGQVRLRPPQKPASAAK